MAGSGATDLLIAAMEQGQGWGGGAVPLQRQRQEADGKTSEKTVNQGEKHYTEALIKTSSASAMELIALSMDKGLWPKAIELDLSHLDADVATRLEEARVFSVTQKLAMTNINEAPHGDAQSFCEGHAKALAMDKLTIEEWVMAYGLRLPILTNMLRALFEYSSMVTNLGMPNPTPEALEKMMEGLVTTAGLKKEDDEIEGVEATPKQVVDELVASAKLLTGAFHGYRKQMRLAEKELNNKRWAALGEEKGEIDAVIETFAMIGALGDVAIDVAATDSAGGKAKKVGKALGVPTDLESIGRTAATLALLDDLKQIESHMESLEVHEDILNELDAYDVMKKHKDTFLGASGTYSTKVFELVGNGGAEKGMLEAQEEQYKKFGTRMDHYAESRSDLSHLAPHQKGGERYETLLAVVGKFRTAWTLSSTLNQMELGVTPSSSASPSGEFSAMFEGIEARRSERHSSQQVKRLTVPPAEHKAFLEMKSSLELGETFAREFAPFEPMLERVNTFVHDPGEGYAAKEKRDAT
ncbi:MAG: hypothetical protein AUK47_00230 [Deltaproteobacteria bacterium CG2_30_63_29]|nr:MAG: hypothetical protein AUK47_00230 [Deltaproteobacteria bacterium CG2_30_63_29]PJB33904.1 MAG: hypothetical protein CO108_29730 [Deltaproteobacteria bacterium CG_4_9_14_3_um_filter_63_12]